MESRGAKVSVVICTANRGSSVVATLDSILLNTYDSFEVLLVDQSDGGATEAAVQRFVEDPRFRYFRSATKGSGRAHNIGLAHTTADIVLYTDDDCTVPPNWIEGMLRAFEEHPQVAVVFCNVEPGPHDPKAGFIPIYVRRDSQIVRSLWDKCQARGIGAGMGVRRDAVQSIGGFDNSLGPGGKFRACMDGDLAVRALISRWWVYETHEVSVVHHGFRTWEQGKGLTARAWYGIGAAYAKPLKCGRWDILYVLAYEGLGMGLLHPLSALLRLRRPMGIKRFFYFLQGFFHGLRTPVDPKHLVYDLT